MALRCASCGEENPERAKFCLACGEPLGAVQPAGEERKVVSVLFADLVGHTAASDRADPEDVRATLSAYHARMKTEIERFGGTVEKFVGDAVMAVFGAPTAHEDDAERAARAGLAILEAVEQLGLSVRVAVNTGEAVVVLGARPELGEGIVTGDVVNTAARLQAAAPTGALVAGEQTYWATRHAIEYESLEPVAAKGKAEPVPLWRALGARSRFGVDVEPGRRAQLVGRDDELALVRQAYARTLRESACHLVTLIGEAGIGKSRLVAELREHVDAQPELVFWRQGRCLPYGDGIAFWALGEIVKAQAGILESDDPGAAREKLDLAVEPLVDSTDRSWVAGALARLVGAGREQPGAGGTRDESFAAWRTFLEGIAAQRPLVLVVEDLHWADAALVEFLEHLADRATDVPLLVICTARPELHELHPTWSGGKRNATTISLSPLSAGDTARLVGSLLERAVLPAELQQQLLDRAGGNPLYAEQFVRMLRERPAGEEMAVPETVQALIAARLDTLGAERKALLQDAAVVGKVFWSGALAAMAGADETAVREALHELVRRELIRPARRSSVESQYEYAFGHALVRDVAYAQIPRAARARKHEAAARWIEGIAGERVADHAELLAHHYREALELAAVAGIETATLEDPARRFLVLAAERAAAIDVRRAESLFEAALSLTPPGHPARGRIMTTAVEWGALEDRPLDEVAAFLEEALTELGASNDEVGFGKAKLVLSHITWIRGDGDADRLLLEAVELLERHPPGPELAHAYALLAGRDAIGGRHRDAIDSAAKAITLSERLGLQTFLQRGVQFRGIARCGLGDLGGIDDLRDALRVSLDLGLTREAEIGYNNYASWAWLSSGADAAIPVYEEAVDFYERRGRSATWSKGEMTWPLFDAGRWDDVLAIADEMEEYAAVHGSGQPLLMARASKARVLFYRGQTQDAEAISRELLPRAREIGDPQILLPALSVAVLVEPGAAAVPRLVEELLAVDAPENPMYADPARVCVRLGALDLAERMMRSDERAAPRAQHVTATIRALLAEERGATADAAAFYDEAADRWASYPFVLERAHCLLGSARCAAALRDTASAAARASAASDLFRSLGAHQLEREAVAIADNLAA